MLPSPEQAHTLHERKYVPIFKKGFAQPGEDFYFLS